MSSVFERNSTYSGLSSVCTSTATQQLSLCTEKGSTPYAHLHITDKNTVIGLRDAFISVLYHLRKGFSYRPSEAVSTSPSLQESFEALGQSYDAKNAMKDHQELISFIEQHDADSFLQPDASIHVYQEGIIWELFDKKATMAATIHLKDGFTKKGEWKEGTSTVDTTLALFNSLETIGNDSLDIEVSSDPALDSGYKSSNEYAKKERIPLYWPRTWLQLQAYFTEDYPTLELNRMEAYNLMRFLRLNKASSTRRSLVLQFEAGSYPAIVVAPFGKRFSCTSHIYEGQSFQVNTWETDFLWIFEPLLPIMKSLRVQVRGTALPVIWEVDCGTFTLAISDLGYSPANWSKCIMMDIDSPRAKLGSRSDTKALVQKGMCHYNPFSKMSTTRTLFPNLDLTTIEYRDDAEKSADKLVFTPKQGEEVNYSLINSALMDVKKFIKNTDDLNVLKEKGKAINTAFTALQTEVLLSLSQIKRAYAMFPEVVTVAAEILRRERNEIDALLLCTDKDALRKNRIDKDIIERLWEYLYGIPQTRGVEAQEGMLAKTARLLSSKNHPVSEVSIQKLFTTTLNIESSSNTQYDALMIYNSIQGLLMVCNDKIEDSKSILHNRPVQIHTKINLDESIDFLDCSVQDSDGTFSPQFSYSPIKGLQRASCTCTRTNNEICVHLKSLWLQHCIDDKALEIAQRTEKSLITHQKANYIQLTEENDIKFTVEQMYRKIVVMRGIKKTTRIFSDVQTAGVAFQHQVDIFDNKGFLRAGK